MSGKDSRRDTGAPSTDPRVIRAAIAHAGQHTLLAAATRYGVSQRTVQRWRDRAAAAEQAGGQWPSEDDVTYWLARQEYRAEGRARARRWQRRRALAGGPLLVDPTGTLRRLRALSALGWRLSDLAEQLGVSEPRVWKLLSGQSDTVVRDTASVIAELYDRLSMTPGPSDITRARAEKLGWAGPLCWDDDTIDDPKARPRRSGGRALKKGQAFDEIAIERAMAGDDVHLTPAERAEAVRRLTDRGLSAKQIALRLRVTGRTAVRARSRETAA